MRTVARIVRFEGELLEVLKDWGWLASAVNAARQLRTFIRRKRRPKIIYMATERIKANVTWHIPPATETIRVVPRRLTSPPLSPETESVTSEPPTAKGEDQ